MACEGAAATQGEALTNDLDIRTLDLREAWNFFKTEIAMEDETYRKARFGIKVKFDINDYLKGRIPVKAKTGKALVRGQAHKLEDFETELEVRERIIKDWLLQNFGEEELVSPRGILNEPK